ncbi:hypothetical protein N9C66_03215 [Akkermansiaceae bacterium]|nr:hypothetical protein [Akkermansiaceae bacterium]
MFSVDGEFGDGVEISVTIANVDKLGILVVSPGGSIVDKPEGAIGSKKGIGRALDFYGKIEVLDSNKVLIFIKSAPFDEGAIPVPEEQTVIEVLGESTGFFELGIVVEDGPGTGGAPPFFEFWELFRIRVRVEDES